MPKVAAIAVTPVKGFALDHPAEIEVTEQGVVEDRRFLLVDDGGRRLRSSLTAWPIVVRGSYDAKREVLRVTFPGGVAVEDTALSANPTFEIDFHGRMVPGRVLDGPWTEPLSELAGHPVRIARPEQPGEGQTEPLTFVSQASVDRLAEEAGEAVDGRRFRMLFTLAGCAAHEEDEWEGRLARVGETLVRIGGPVARCAVTTRDPDTGERDLDTLALIRRYRGQLDDGAIPFGVYGRIERPGRVRVGDPVELL